MQHGRSRGDNGHHKYPLIVLLFWCSYTGLADAQDTGALWNPGARCVVTADYIQNVQSTCQAYVVGQNFTYIDDLQPLRDNTLVSLSQIINTANNCTTRSVQLLCSVAYRECYEVDVPGFGVAAVGTLPCRAFCEIWQAECFVELIRQGFTAEQLNSVLNCTTLSDFWGFGSTTHFPNGTLNQPVTINFTTPVTVNVSLPCSDRAASIFAGFGDLVCPEGTHNEGPNACAINCPEPLISDNEYDQAKLMLSVVGWFSFIGTAFVVVSFMLSPMDKLAYPSVLSFFFTVCIMCLSFTFCLASMVGHEEIWCKDEFTPNRWGDGWCTIQGITYVFFTLAGGLWWLSISINLVATVVFGYTPSKRIIFSKGALTFTEAYLLIGICHLLCWGIPLVVVIITLSSHHLGFGGSDFWCSIHSDENVSYVISSSGLGIEGSSDDQAIDIWNLILLTIPMILITFVGTVLFVIVLVVALFRSQEGLMFFVHQWRLLGLLMLYIWIYSFVFSAHIQFATQRKQQYQDYADYIQCLKVNAYLGKFIGGTCSLPQRVNFALWFIASFNVAAGGFFVFLIFGTSKGVAKSWAKIAVVVFTCGNKQILSSLSLSTPGGSADTGGLKKIVGMPVGSSSARSMTHSLSQDDSDTDTSTHTAEEGDNEDSSEAEGMKMAEM